MSVDFGFNVPLPHMFSVLHLTSSISFMIMMQSLYWCRACSTIFASWYGLRSSASGQDTLLEQWPQALAWRSSMSLSTLAWYKVYCTQPAHTEATKLVCPHHKGVCSPIPSGWGAWSMVSDGVSGYHCLAELGLLGRRDQGTWVCAGCVVYLWYIQKYTNTLVYTWYIPDI